MSHTLTATDKDFYISVDEMVQLSGTSRPTIYRWLSNGTIPAFHLGPNGRTKRVPRQTFMAILEHAKKGGLGLQAALRDSSAWGGNIPKPSIREISRESVLDVPAGERARSPRQQIRRLAQLEQRYRIGSASLAEKVVQGKPLPRNVPRKTAEAWAATLARVGSR